MSDEPTRDFAEVTHDLANTYFLGQVSGNSARAAEYQRQQLNLLRQHQGLPPVPPPVQTNIFAEVFKLVLFIFVFVCTLALVAQVVGVLIAILFGKHNW